MSDTSQPSSDRSAHGGGNASGTTVQTDDYTRASVHSQPATLPPPEHVDMRAELVALREALTRLESPERRKIANALSDAEDELAKPWPDKNEVGKALERTLDYARKAAGFSGISAVLQPHVRSAATWLGEHWYRLCEPAGLPEDAPEDAVVQRPDDRPLQVGEDAAGHTVMTGNGRVVVIQTTRLLALDDPAAPSGIGPNPYQGLTAFTEKEANRFFGREALTRQLWEMCRRLHEPRPNRAPALRLLPILGPSGCGKSSLARAGLLPALARQPLPGLQQLRVAVLTPGTHPVEALAGVLGRLATDGPAVVAKSQECAEALRTPNTTGAYDGLSRIAAALPGIATAPLIVLIDQYEELYALCEDTTAQHVFVANLLYAAADRTAHVSVVLTLRSDFLEHTQRHAALNQAIAAHGVIVPALDAAALRLAIAEPAAWAKHPFDTATVELLVAAGQADALALLQFALTRIWEELAQGMALADTLQHIGGLNGALAGEAQRLYDSLSEVDQAIARRAFVGLVRLGEGTPDTRRRVAIADLMMPGENLDHVRHVLGRFARPATRLLTFAAAADGTETVEITHETLCEHWGTLHTWLARRRAERHLLHHGDDEVPGRVDDETPGRVDDAVPTAFVPAPVRRERPARRRQRAVSAILLVLALAASALALVAWEEQTTTTQERDRAEMARQSAEQERDQARRRLHDVRTLANAFMFDFHTALEPRTDSAQARIGVVKKALEYLDSLAQEAHDDAALQRNLGVSYSKIGDTLAATGDTAGALEQYRKGLVIWDEFATAESTNTEAQHQLSISYNKIGDALAATGDTAGALEQYRKGLAIRDRLARAEPSNAQAQRDVAVSYSKTGIILEASGDPAGALKHYATALPIFEALARAEPANAQAHQDLAQIQKLWEALKSKARPGK